MIVASTHGAVKTVVTAAINHKEDWCNTVLLRWKTGQ